jgi:hypothetical protein
VAADGERKLVLVTFDGVRWQEVFRGADAALSANAEYTNLGEWLMTAYLEPEDRAAAVMPFVHGVMAEQGVLIGDRDAGECAEVANDMWFSYLLSRLQRALNRPAGPADRLERRHAERQRHLPRMAEPRSGVRRPRGGDRHLDGVSEHPQRRAQRHPGQRRPRSAANGRPTS